MVRSARLSLVEQVQTWSPKCLWLLRSFVSMLVIIIYFIKNFWLRQDMLSPDGRCKAFDASGNGYHQILLISPSFCHLRIWWIQRYVRSEGFCVLVIKKLSKAIADGDPIRAVIRATGTNQVRHSYIIENKRINSILGRTNFWSYFPWTRSSRSFAPWCVSLTVLSHVTSVCSFLS